MHIHICFNFVYLVFTVSSMQPFVRDRNQATTGPRRWDASLADPGSALRTSSCFHINWTSIQPISANPSGGAASTNR